MSPRKTLDSSNTFKKKDKSLLAYLAGKLPLIIILVIVVVAFVLVPLISGITPTRGGSLVFGSYGDEKIEYKSGTYFYNQVNMINNMYRDQLSQSEELFDFYRYYIWSSAYQQTVLFKAKKYDLTRSGFQFSDRGVSRLIVNSGYYHNEQGEFDEAAYANTTMAQRDEIKRTLLDSAYLDHYNKDRLGGIYRSQGQMDFLMEISPEERQFRYVTFTASQYPESKILDYAKEHSRLFTSYPLARITVDSKDKAQNVISQLKDGKSFSELANTNSTDMYATSGGDMGMVYRYALLDELGEEKSEAVLSLAKNAYSQEPIETDYGWYVYMMNGDRVEPDFADEAMISSVRNWMNWNESALLDEWIMDRADSFIASLDGKEGENDFVLEAVNNGYEAKTTDFFPLNWGASPLVGTGLNSSNDSIIQSATQSDDFFQEAFSLEEVGDMSSPVILENAVIVLELLEKRESESKPTENSSYSQLQQMQESLYGGIVTSSELYKDSFMDTYYQVFPPESSQES